MRLNSLPSGPEPTDAELAQHLNRFDEYPSAVRSRLASLAWELEQRRLNPDSFLVPFFDGADYQQYLLSPTWQRIRRKVLRDARHECVGCEAKATDVHHRDYRPRVLSGEDMTPLVALCKACHAKVEKARKYESWQAGERALAELVTQKAANLQYSS